MQPKDLLVHLEKGDRTKEFLRPRSVRAQWQQFASTAAGLRGQQMHSQNAAHSQNQMLNSYLQMNTWPLLAGDGNGGSYGNNF